MEDVQRENFVYKGDVSRSCEAADMGCFVFEGQITASLTAAVLETVTKLIFCHLFK